MSNRQIADALLNSPRALVIADSAEPKSIDEIKHYGISILGAEKGKDSVVHGIQIVQAQAVSVTERLLNIIKEYRNYLWIVDRDGKITNEPDHEFSHSMDAIRYALVFLVKTPSFVPRLTTGLVKVSRECQDNRYIWSFGETACSYCKDLSQWSSS